MQFGESHEIAYCSADRHGYGSCPGPGADADDNVHHHHADIGRRDPNYHNLVRRIIDDDDHHRINEYDNLSAARLRLSADGRQWL
jgi:hypothetical protein